jgi:uncharacterized protein YkwD
MRLSIALPVLLVSGCGQMYRQPGAQPDPQPPPPAAPSVMQPAPPPAPPPIPAAAPREPAPAGDVRSSPPPALQGPAAIAQRFVDAHNRVRAKHCAGPVSWSPKLADVAQKWANTLRDKGCVFGHSGGSYGENLAAGTEGVLDPEATVKMWYDEIQKYRFPDGGFSMQTGHFTQVVWRGTTSVGCGHVTCNGNDIWVCNYDPAGNWEGQYRENVLPAGCR